MTPNASFAVSFVPPEMVFAKKDPGSQRTDSKMNANIINTETRAKVLVETVGRFMV